MKPSSRSTGTGLKLKQAKPPSPITLACSIRLRLLQPRTDAAHLCAPQVEGVIRRETGNAVGYADH